MPQHSSTKRVETHVRKKPLNYNETMVCAYSGNAANYCRRDEMRFDLMN